MPEMDNDQAKRVAAKLHTRGDGKGDVEKGSPGALRTSSDSIPAERRINEFALRGEVVRVGRVLKSWYNL